MWGRFTAPGALLLRLDLAWNVDGEDHPGWQLSRARDRPHEVSSAAKTSCSPHPVPIRSVHLGPCWAPAGVQPRWSNCPTLSPGCVPETCGLGEQTAHPRTGGVRSLDGPLSGGHLLPRPPPAFPGPGSCVSLPAWRALGWPCVGLPRASDLTAGAPKLPVTRAVWARVQGARVSLHVLCAGVVCM